MIMCGVAFADSCDKGAQKVVSKLTAHHMKAVNLSYSKDQEAKKDTCIAAIKKLDPTITVNPTLVSGADTFKFSKAN